MYNCFIYWVWKQTHVCLFLALINGNVVNAMWWHIYSYINILHINKGVRVMSYVLGSERWWCIFRSMSFNCTWFWFKYFSIYIAYLKYKSLITSYYFLWVQDICPMRYTALTSHCQAQRPMRTVQGHKARLHTQFIYT